MTRSNLTYSIALASALACSAASAAQDAEFAKKAAEGGMAEVQLGQIAASNASDAGIKNFGQHMVTDHSSANDELKAAAQQDGVQLPQDMSKEHKAAADRLSKLQGDAFDKEYARMMVKDHEEDVALFKKEASSGKDTNLKAFAQKTLPKLEDHLKMAQQLDASTKKTSSRQ